MRILLISVSAPPKNSPESLQTGRYLKYLSKKNDVTLLTTDIRGGWEPFDISLQRYLSPQVKVVATKTLNFKVVSALKKIFPCIFFPDDAAFFLWQFKKAAPRILKPEVIFSRSAPFSSAVMALKFSTHWDVPWVVHFSDPWASSPFLKCTARERRRHEKMEQQCINAAQLVTFTSYKTIDSYASKYPDQAFKFRFLPNVFDEVDINPKPVAFTGKIKFVFTGRLYGNRIVHPLLEAIERACARAPAFEGKSEFIFAGFFIEENIRRIEEVALSNLTYLGPLSFEKTVELQQEATVLISIDSLDGDPGYDVFFPSKLLDYLAARRLIIAITGSTSTTFDIIEGKFGKCFGPENLDQLPGFFIEILNQFESQNLEFFTLPLNFIEYGAKPNSDRLEEMLKGVCDAQ